MRLKYIRSLSRAIHGIVRTLGHQGLGLSMTWRPTGSM